MTSMGGGNCLPYICHFMGFMSSRNLQQADLTLTNDPTFSKSFPYTIVVTKRRRNPVNHTPSEIMDMRYYVPKKTKDGFWEVSVLELGEHGMDADSDGTFGEFKKIKGTFMEYNCRSENHDAFVYCCEIWWNSSPCDEFWLR